MRRQAPTLIWTMKYFDYTSLSTVQIKPLCFIRWKEIEHNVKGRSRGSTGQGVVCNGLWELQWAAVCPTPSEEKPNGPLCPRLPRLHGHPLFSVSTTSPSYNLSRTQHFKQSNSLNIPLYSIYTIYWCDILDPNKKCILLFVEMSPALDYQWSKKNFTWDAITSWHQSCDCPLVIADPQSACQTISVKLGWT